jgi:uncharacterized lipoprotein YehR (DUF1307 family)
MRIGKNIIMCCLLAVCSLALSGCGKKADESKAISEIRAEADKLSAAELRTMAMKYKDAIVAKKAEVEKVAGKLKDIPLAEKLGTEAKELSAEIAALNKSVSALTERFGVYYQKLKDKGGDLAGLEI